MHALSRALLQLVVVAALAAPALRAQAQPVEVIWGDRWNEIYHRLTDLDGDGSFTGPGEVAWHMDPASPASDRPLAMRVTEEDGQLVTYWLIETLRVVARGVDLDGNGQLGPGEMSAYRDYGNLDGDGWPAALDITDDGAVWYSTGQLISQPMNGLARLEDLNGDGDANDAGEQVLMVDGNSSSHLVEHDLGTAAITSWHLSKLAAVGNGVIAHAGIDEAIYRFEDTNQDGDVTDPGESILLLNASGERPDLPQNPDFADGSLPSLQTLAGYPASLSYMASALEDGQRVFYLGTNVSPFNSSGTNLQGQGLNFLIFRAVDGNGDGDVNDAGEVHLFYDGSHTSGDPDLLVPRGLDALDGGTVYAVGLKPYPVLGPGEDGDTWIHRFEDLDGDGDAMDAGERQLEVFGLQAFGDTALFPYPPLYGNMMADPWDFTVRRLTRFTDMGGGSNGSQGVPTLSGTGTLEAGSPFTVDLVDAPPGALMLSWLSVSSSPLPVFGGTLYTFPYLDELFWLADGSGELSLAANWPAGLPAGTDVFVQFLVADNGVVWGLTLSNALKLTTP